MRAALPAIIAGLLVGLVPAGAGAAVGDEIVLERRPGLTASERGAMRAGAGVKLRQSLPLPRVEVVTARPGGRAAALASLRKDPGVVWAEPNRPRRIAAGSWFWPELWGLQNTGQTVLRVTGTPDADIDAPEAWAYGKGAGVTVAVVDTGVQAHPDLSLVRGWDFVDGDDTPVDGHGHGTHVAGTIAALENSQGIIGVAPQAHVMALRALDDTGSGTSADVAAAFAYAGERTVPVVNASIGSAHFSRAEHEAIRAHPSTLFVVAAGNEGADNDREPSYPCAYDLPNLLCVGASDQRDRPAAFSNSGRGTVDLHAPGVNVLSTYLNGAYAYMDGTSMAAPHAAGAAALLAAYAPVAGALALKSALMDGADPVPALAGTSVTGARLNVAGALERLDATAPAAPAGVTATGGSGWVRLSWQASPEPSIASYRVYAGGSPPGSAPVAQTAGTTWQFDGLDPGTVFGYQVTAVDRAGNESPRSAIVSARTADRPPLQADDPPLVQDPGVAEPDLGADPEPLLATVKRLRVVGRVTVCGRRACRSRRGWVAFRLGADARVTVTVQRRKCRGKRCRYVKVRRTRFRMAAGPQRLAAGPRLAGARLRPGTWRVTVATTDARRRVTLRARGR